METAAFQPEQKLLIIALRGASAEERRQELYEAVESRDRLDGDYLQELARHHGCSGALFHELSQLSPDIFDSSFFRVLRAEALSIALLGLYLESELLKFIDLLSAADIPFIPIKGPLLAELLYPSPAMRVSGDLDLLVPRAHLQGAIQLAEQADYFPPSSYSETVKKMILANGNHYHVQRSDGKSLVELHWDWIPANFGLPIVDLETWKRGRKTEWHGRKVRILGPEDLLLLLTVHGTKHRWPILKWAVDVSQLLYLVQQQGKVRDELQGFDWDLFLGLCAHPDLKRMVAVGLLTVEHLLGPRLPAAIHTELARDRTAAKISRRLADEIFTAKGRLSGLRQTLYRLQYRRRLPDRIRYLRKIVFSPSPIEAETFRLPRGLHWTYPLLRVARLTFKYAQPENWRPRS